MFVLSAGEKKTVKKPSQNSQGVPVGPKIGFKRQKGYRPIPKKTNASPSGNKKKGVELTIEFSSNGTQAIDAEGRKRSSYARAMIELRADVELKDYIVVVMPKITREGHYTCNVRFEYEWKPPRCSSCKVFGHIHGEYLKNTGVGEKKTSTGSSSGNKKKGEKPTIEVSNSNLFDVLNSVDNDVEFGTNRGTSNLVNIEATLVPIGTLIGEKIDKIRRQICEVSLRLLDNDEKSLVLMGIVKSDSEVEVVFDETANLKILTSGKDGSDKRYGTNSLLEQWRDSYPDNDDYDPYDHDMNENYDLSKHLQSICDKLDITVRGRKKK
nr:hypothetical protein [Tanacetum cinerariifolium]